MLFLKRIRRKKVEFDRYQEKVTTFESKNTEKATKRPNT
jgi:hypothetical protein